MIDEQEAQAHIADANRCLYEIHQPVAASTVRGLLAALRDARAENSSLRQQSREHEDLWAQSSGRASNEASRARKAEAEVERLTGDLAAAVAEASRARGEVARLTGINAELTDSYNALLIRLARVTDERDQLRTALTGGTDG